MKHILQKLYCLFRQYTASFIKKNSILYTFYKRLKEKKEKNQINSLLEMKPEIFIYFSGTLKSVDEFKQWSAVFRALSQDYSLVIVVRDKEVEKYLKKSYSFNIYCAINLNQLLFFYQQLSPKIIFYINNDYRNFQSLIYNNSMHIFLSSLNNIYSNQIKAYDFVFVSGRYELDNYMHSLLRIQEDRFIQVGRPALDCLKKVNLNTMNKKVILYVPLVNEENLHCVQKIVDNILDSGEYFLIYNPSYSDDNERKVLDNNIIKKVKNSRYANFVVDSNSIYHLVDLAIFDILQNDYLYVDKPFLLTNTFSVTENKKTNFLQGYKQISKESLSNGKLVIANEIQNDSQKEKRKELRKYYMNGLEIGESIRSFKDNVKKSIDFRDIELKNKQDRLRG